MRIIKLFSWLVGVATLVWLSFFFGWAETLVLIESVNIYMIIAWIAATVTSRMILVEALVRPLAQLGISLKRSECFWLAWIRSFFNQIVPLSGVAYFAGYLKIKTTLTWSAMAALGSPQLLIAPIGIGLLGLISTLLVWKSLGDTAWLILGSFLFLLFMPIVIVGSSDSLLTRLPSRLQNYLLNFRRAWTSLHNERSLLVGLVTVHFFAVLLRAVRLGLLFLATGFSIDWGAILLVSCVGEVILLLQITPGGIGLREGTLVGVAALVGMDPKIVAGIAVIDRLLIVALVTTMAPLAFWQLNRKDEAKGIDTGCT